MASSTKQKIADDIIEFFDDPLGFIIYSFPWGVKGTPLETFPLGPDEWQRDECEAIKEHVRGNLLRQAKGESQLPYRSAIASGHGIGKSAFMSWIMIWLMSTRKHCRGVTTANTGDQLADTTWPELAKWHNMAINKEWFIWRATQFYCVLDKDGEKNWRFNAATWSLEHTEAFAGRHNASSAVVVLYDEASGIPDKIWEVSEGAMTDGEPFWFAFGNPTRNTGRFRQCFSKFRRRWRTRHIDSREVRITNKELYHTWIEDYGEDSDFVRVRVKGQFPRGGSRQLISCDIVERAQKGTVVPDKGSPLIMGIDVARSGDDQAVIRWRQGRNGNVIEPSKFRGIDNMELANRAAYLINMYKPDAINIDAGNGSGVIDRLRELGFRVNEVWFGSSDVAKMVHLNKRVEMYVNMKDWLAEGGVIDDDAELYEDLISQEWEPAGTEGDKIKLKSKEDQKKEGHDSPDNGDALALTFAVNVARRDLKNSRYGRRGAVARDLDYNVFDY